MKHPLHPALVHFPVACWSLATAADTVGLFRAASYWQLSGLLLAIGTLVATVAMAAGLAELPDLEPGSTPSRDARRHMLLAATAWSCYAASLFLRIEEGALTRPGALAIGLGVLGFLSLCGAGWMGGRLVYEHGIGVRKRG
ncbi:DUF2231 domain-containing protein [Lysobacter sp. TAF61]|uniref:DUF2231 domain-containing protein n=1 Tax=Lysobacter sp. TAF61 TaxID=3233072 RepID=UPI003F9709FA